MAIHKFFIFLCLSLVHAQNYNCPPSYCEDHGVNIHFPFWLQGEQTRKNCQPIGFNLSCNGMKKAVLKVPYSGDFYVRYIYYNTKRVVLIDPDNCFPRRLLSLNLSSTPFMPVSYQNYTLHTCPKGLVSRYVIDCLSNTTTDIVAVEHEADLMKFPQCNKFVTLQAPVSSYFDDNGFPVNLDLTWDGPSPVTVTENKRPVSRIIALSFVIPASVIIIIGISCLVFMRRRKNRSSQTSGLSDMVRPGLQRDHNREEPLD